MGILAIPEKRDNINKFKKFNTEDVNRIVDSTKALVTIGGVVATVVLAVCPIDGPVGEIATLLATPLLVKQVEKLREPLKTLMVNGNDSSIPVANVNSSGSSIQNIIDRDLVESKKIGWHYE